MATQLTSLIERYQHHRQAFGRAPGTIERYTFTSLHFTRFLDETKRPHSSDALTTETLEAFAIWLRDTPVREQNGTTKRQESGIHAHLRDMRAFTRWLYRNELLPEEVFVPMPKLQEFKTSVSRAKPERLSEPHAAFAQTIFWPTSTTKPSHLNRKSNKPA